MADPSDDSVINQVKNPGGLLKKIQRATHLGIWTCAFDFSEMYWSSRVFELLGIDPKAEPSIQLMKSNLHPAELELFESRFSRLTTDGIGFCESFKIIPPSGNIRLISWEVWLDEDPGNTEKQFTGILKDLTEELQNKELVERLNLSQKIGKIGYWEFDIETEEIFWSDEVFRIWGLEKKGLQPNFQLFIQSFHPDDLENFLPQHYAALEGKQPLDAIHRIISTDGKIKFVHEKGWLEMDISTGKNKFKGTVQDITYQKEIEQKLMDRNSFIESTLMNLPMGIAVSNAKTGEITFMNPAYTQTYGWEQNNQNSENGLVEKINPDSVFGAQLNKKNQDTEQMIWNDVPILTKSGESRYVSSKNILLSGQDLMISIVQDVTDRIKAEQSLKISNDRFLLANMAVSDAIWDWDILTGQYYYGEGFNLLLDEKISGENTTYDFWKSKIHPEDRQRVDELMAEILREKTRNSYEMEYRFQKNKTTTLYLTEKGTVIRDQLGKPIRMVGAIQDITRRKAYEESLKILNSELANSNRELEISNKELEQFAYVASHDLQEPLRMITSFLSLLEKKYAYSLDERGQQYIRFAVDGAKRMREIILDLLEFSRMGHLTEEKKPVNVNQLVREVLSVHQETIQAKKARVHLNKLPEILCYPNSILQVFQNLISNALKYQDENRSPELVIDFSENKDFWIFSVKDNGIGIEKEYLEKIFVIFQRLHPRDQYSGTGIGLAICKKIVELHGGKIWAESELGKGSTFYFSILKK